MNAVNDGCVNAFYCAFCWLLLFPSFFCFFRWNVLLGWFLYLFWNAAATRELNAAASDLVLNVVFNVPWLIFLVTILKTRLGRTSDRLLPRDAWGSILSDPVAVWIRSPVRSNFFNSDSKIASRRVHHFFYFTLYWFIENLNAVS